MLFKVLGAAVHRIDASPIGFKVDSSGVASETEARKSRVPQHLHL